MNRLPIEFLPGATDEAIAVHGWYAARSRLAASRFLEEFDRLLSRLQANPLCGGMYLHGTRCCLFRSFPYLLVYRPTKEALQIVAIAHARRRPGYWKSRQ